MKKIIFVVFLLLISFVTRAANLNTALAELETDWAAVYYNSAYTAPSTRYQQLLQRAQTLALQFANRAEPLLWQAIIMATDAEHQTPVKALEQINAARDLLLKVIALDPQGVEGSAHVTLGSLYYLTPGWPIAFGDDAKAEGYLQQALRINPNSIDANYFYGDFLVSQGKSEQALAYFNKALSIAPRKRQLFADKSLQQHAAVALRNATAGKAKRAAKIMLSLSSTAN